MKTLAWGAGCLVTVIALLYLLLLAKIGIADIVYAMLSGAIVGTAVSLFAYARGLTSDRAVIVLFASILSAAASWLIALLLVKLTKVNLLGITALAFDLLVGIIGAATIAYTLTHWFMAKQSQR
jgi:hypothetical protein